MGAQVPLRTCKVIGEASREEKQGNPGCKYRDVSLEEKEQENGSRYQLFK